jgi:hypothetical protein
MAATKTGTTILSSQSLAALGTVTTSVVNLTTAYGCVLTAQITNGASAPTVACGAVVKISPDGTNFYQWAAATAGVAANGAYPFAWDLPASAMYATVTFAGNTGQAVTVACQSEALTGL